MESHATARSRPPLPFNRFVTATTCPPTASDRKRPRCVTSCEAPHQPGAQALPGKQRCTMWHTVFPAAVAPELKMKRPRAVPDSSGPCLTRWTEVARLVPDQRSLQTAKDCSHTVRRCAPSHEALLSLRLHWHADASAFEEASDSGACAARMDTYLHRHKSGAEDW